MPARAGHATRTEAVHPSKRGQISQSLCSGDPCLMLKKCVQQGPIAQESVGRQAVIHAPQLCRSPYRDQLPTDPAPATEISGTHAHNPKHDGAKRAKLRNTMRCIAHLALSGHEIPGQVYQAAGEEERKPRCHLGAHKKEGRQPCGHLPN